MAATCATPRPLPTASHRAASPPPSPCPAPHRARVGTSPAFIESAGDATLMHGELHACSSSSNSGGSAWQTASHSIAANVGLGHAPEAVAILQHNEKQFANINRRQQEQMVAAGGVTISAHFACADDLTQVDVHPCVTKHHVSIVCLPILQLYQL